MEIQSLRSLTVLGGGVLGSQIAWHSAYKGKQVTVYDLHQAGLDNCRSAHDRYEAIYLQELGASAADIAATKARLDFTTDVASAVAEADIVIENVPEIPEVKIQAYRDMAPLLPAHTLLATNSSTFLPSDFAIFIGNVYKAAVANSSYPVYVGVAAFELLHKLINSNHSKVVRYLIFEFSVRF